MNKHPDAGTTHATAAARFAVAAAALALGLAPLPAGLLRDAQRALRATDPDRDDREAGGAGYYEALLNGGAGAGHGAGRDEAALLISGKPARSADFLDTGATRFLPGTFIQFDLHPNVDRRAFGVSFTTNALGLRDREGYAPAKPPGTFRIALLGSSIDMGWGVATDSTYENRLEDWLNRRAARLGMGRRFEVMNFAMAAYGPAQRLEAYRAKAAAFDPDLVLYSATMLDGRLTQIHLTELLRGGVDPSYGFVREALTRAGVGPADLRRKAGGDLAGKAALKARLAEELWPIADGALGELADACRSAGRPIACLIVPRASLADAPSARADAVARHRAIAARHAVPVLDLSAAFDDSHPADLEIAAWDDHPNAEGHELLFRTLARSLLDDPRLGPLLFPGPAESSSPIRNP